MHDVLQLDITGQPQAWISVEQAAVHVATRSVAWSLGPFGQQLDADVVEDVFAGLDIAHGRGLNHAVQQVRT